MDLTDIIVFQPPASPGDIENMKLIRMAALDLARAIRDCCPGGADQKAAINRVRESVMYANEAIKLKGLSV